MVSPAKKDRLAVKDLCVSQLQGIEGRNHEVLEEIVLLDFEVTNRDFKWLLRCYLSQILPLIFLGSWKHWFSEKLNLRRHVDQL